jgi:hypothetical protein
MLQWRVSFISNSGNGRHAAAGYDRQHKITDLYENTAMQFAG